MPVVLSPVNFLSDNQCFYETGSNLIKLLIVSFQMTSDLFFFSLILERYHRCVTGGRRPVVLFTSVSATRDRPWRASAATLPTASTLRTFGLCPS